MSRPYASVILPTLNRHTTLPLAIASVLKQSEGSLELIIVLDGASQLCRKEAYIAASNDNRVRVLDLPKAPANGERNTDFAVNQATADKIFYLDDDDLFLPHHVATLGEQLEHADVVDSRLCSADMNGGLHLGVAPCSNNIIRESLSHYKLKMLYDTHFAHLKSAYGKYSSWIPPEGEGKRPVWDFFSGFAANSACRWVSTESVTAINLHGACRRHMSLTERAKELEYWQKLSAKPAYLENAIEQADVGFNLFRLLNKVPVQDVFFREYLAQVDGYASIDGQVPESIFKLCAGEKPDQEVAIKIAARSSELVESGYWSIPVANKFCKVYGVEKTALLFAAAEEHSHFRAGNLLARSSIEKRRNIVRALDYAQQACKAGPDPINILKNWYTELKSIAVR